MYVMFRYHLHTISINYMTVTFQIFKLSSNQNFILLLINFIFYVIFYLLLYVPEFFFLSYSFVMFRINFLLSIWINLHIYIDIVFVGLVFGLKFLLIILYYIWHMKHLYFFGEKSKLQPMSSSLRINFYLVCYI